MLKDILIVQAALTGLTAAFLYYLGVRSMDIYISLYTLIYLATMTMAEPMPRRVRLLNMAIAYGLIAVFTYFAALRIMAILGVG